MVHSTAQNPYCQVGDVVPVYLDVRPGYPAKALASVGVEPHHVVVDVGAGTGKLTATLASLAREVWAVEPSADMRDGFRISLPDFPTERLIDASAERLPFADASVDILTFGQCWHWLDERRSAIEAARVLRPGGVVAILFNQLDVRQPWVHRLSRIMRSGDVHRADRAPDLRVPGHHGHMERPFSEIEFASVTWIDRLTPAQIAELGTTRSSWIRADDAGRARMRANLNWYMYEHLGWLEDGVVGLPYQLQLWTTSRLGRKDH
ncbi:class I SAM-dependent methyltransferase [Trueperella pyogenes]|uniref:class I SAM-dependent methyltransferase n=1 Tax=Trueperella pyogenes TaxID=1661 RepID=UPI00043AC03B|nr:class I SAM-dependent methyltransferase [Trueperella pyogenes]AHU89052.1 SAM-dependent methyltransferase [Trueperella pyogenes]AWG03082.1 class I SAM-dependent methyltransferase [Trueperella pyogenes]AWG15811.1 class I SAM-dependent methyltransferase [Trueperella pyogenes]AZR04695.1 class I SAM-dependent methyltransferase [Trueperella pyogenes]